MHKCLLLAGILLLLAAPIACADESSQTPVDDLSKDCWAHVARCIDLKTHAIPPTQVLSLEFPLRFAERTFWDTAFMFTAPGRWDEYDWRRFSLLAGIGGGSFALDHQVDIESRNRHPRGHTERDIEKWLQYSGDYPAIAGMLGGSLLGGMIFHNEEAKSLAVDAGEALVISNVVFTEPLKQVIGRSRPHDAQGPWHFKPFSGNASMPSGHSTTAFSLAAALSEHFENAPAAAIPSYTIASIVAFSRVRGSDHFVSDVVIGAIIGTVSGRTVVKLERDRRHDAEGRPRTATAWRLEPWIGVDVRGVQLATEW